VNLIKRVTLKISRSGGICISSIRSTVRSGSRLSAAIWATLSILNVVESFFEPRLNSTDLTDSLMKEGIDLLLHIDIELIVVLFEFDGFHSLVHLFDEVAELFFGGLILLRIRKSRRCRFLGRRVLALFGVARG